MDKALGDTGLHMLLQMPIAQTHATTEDLLLKPNVT